MIFNTTRRALTSKRFSLTLREVAVISKPLTPLNVCAIPGVRHIGEIIPEVLREMGAELREGDQDD